MRLGTLLGAAAVGGFFYAHKKRNGEMTLDSIKETARSLFSTAQQRARAVVQPGTNSERMYEGDDSTLRH
ncbi:hypothetical protein BH11MYX1_BH11MYX1_43790 [soil metagenome]